jgi:hypothetical protein
MLCSSFYFTTNIMHLCGFTAQSHIIITFSSILEGSKTIMYIGQHLFLIFSLSKLWKDHILKYTLNILNYSVKRYKYVFQYHIHTSSWFTGFQRWFLRYGIHLRLFIRFRLKISCSELIHM